MGRIGHQGLRFCAFYQLRTNMRFHLGPFAPPLTESRISGAIGSLSALTTGYLNYRLPATTFGPDRLPLLHFPRFYCVFDNETKIEIVFLHVIFVLACFVFVFDVTSIQSILIELRKPGRFRRRFTLTPRQYDFFDICYIKCAQPSLTQINVTLRQPAHDCRVGKYEPAMRGLDDKSQ